mmetsp:Transcript_24470/g.48741  ORF Transcript_24470/g.48741 Transcript_24470/m.48741 type:complete len:222 (+) Transcript_24470:148-813(+)
MGIFSPPGPPPPLFAYSALLVLPVHDVPIVLAPLKSPPVHGPERVHNATAVRRGHARPDARLAPAFARRPEPTEGFVRSGQPVGDALAVLCRPVALRPVGGQLGVHEGVHVEGGRRARRQGEERSRAGGSGAEKLAAATGFHGSERVRGAWKNEGEDHDCGRAHCTGVPHPMLLAGRRGGTGCAVGVPCHVAGLYLSLCATDVRRIPDINDALDKSELQGL